MRSKHRGWQNVLFLIIPYLIILIIFKTIGVFIVGKDNIGLDYGPNTSVQNVIISFFELLGTLLLFFVFMKFVDKEKFINLGFQTKNRLKDFIIGIVLGAVIMAAGFGLLILLDEISFQRIVFDVKQILLSVVLYIIVAVSEEVLLRGYILRSLMISFNKYIALIVSSVLFSLMHGFNPNVDMFGLTAIFLAGILLGISYIHTKNLWFPIALHLSWNLFQTGFGFNVSGGDSYSLIEFGIKENNLLNGGAFGFEGSILSVIAMSLTIIAIAFYYGKLKTKEVKV
jgi:membrane protease YdiL (CAAX protease family)